VQTLAAIAPDLIDRLVLSAAWARPSKFMQSLFQFRLHLLQTDPKGYVESATLLSFAPEWLENNWDRYDRATANPPHDPQEQTIIAERISALLSYDGSQLMKHMPAGSLVLGTEDDMIVPAFLQRDLAEQIPDANLQLLATGGHFYPLSRADAFAALVSDWMRS
jgi:pimeloyl-ACP methyl ester carboxylesterase